MMNVRKRRESKQSVVVVMEGIKTTAEKSGIAPLLKAMPYLDADDELLVLILVYLTEEESGATTTLSYNEPNHHQCNQSCQDDPYIKLLRQEISDRKTVYRQIFKPFNDIFRRNGVNCQVKIAAGLRPTDIITEEANNAKADWIVMDRCFAKDLSFKLSGTECNVSLVSDDEDKAIVDDDVSKCSMVTEVINNPKSPKLMKGSPSLLASTSRVSEKQTTSKKEDIMLGTLPLQISWEVIMEITGGFSTKLCTRGSRNKNYMAYLGYSTDNHSSFLIKRFKEECNSIFEAEKKAALSMNHKNILRLLGYHQSISATVLVYPLPGERSLDNVIYGLEEKKLKFQEKLKIAIGIAQGVRYMHEESPRGPIVHGELQLSNIYLRHDLQPLICGSGYATFLHIDRSTSISDERYQLEDPLNYGAVKLDIFAFGVVLLRLFCRRSMPKDDKSLIEWARPLMLKRKFYELLEEDLEFSDMHGIYRVMAAATQCTKTNATLRPCMSEVISVLKGENFSAIQPSPSPSAWSP